MIRAVLLALAVWLGWASSAPAQVQPCFPDFSWTTPYQQGSIQTTSYNVQTLVFGVVMRGANYNLVYNNVPQSVAQSFTSLTNADAAYASKIQGKYLQALLTEEYGCPLLNEDGPFLLEG